MGRRPGARTPLRARHVLTNDRPVATDPIGSATQVVDRFRDLPGLRMALVTGSVARGLTDEASDLDVYLYWDAVDTARLAEPARLQPLGARRAFGVATAHGYFEKHVLDGRFLDVESVAVATLDAVADALCAPAAVPGWVTKVAAGLRDAVAVVGAAELREWQGRLVLSDATAAAEITARAPRLLAPSVLYELTMGRGDVLSFAARVSHVLLDVVALLAAANRVCVPVDDPKWLPWQLDRLAVTPPAMAARIDRALRQPSPAAMVDLDALVAEVLDIVDARVPGADTRAARFALRLTPEGLTPGEG